ncbi:hypothetical protein ABPG72_021269 [Tetrahymena utriculariae]
MIIFNYFQLSFKNVANQNFQSQICKTHLNRMINFLFCCLFYKRCVNLGSLKIMQLSSIFSEFKKLCSLNISLNNMSLEDQSVEGLGVGIQLCENLKILELNFGKNTIISWYGIYVLGHEISKCQNLEVLKIDIRVNRYQNRDNKLRFQLANLKMLQKLHLDFKYNNIGEDGMNGIYSCIQNNKYIQDLYLNLSYNQILSEEFIKLGQSISILNSLKSLKLYLEKNWICNDGLIQFSQYLRKCFSLQNLSLYLNKNNIEYQGFHKLSYGISLLDNLQQLELNLSNNQIQGRYNQEICSYLKLHKLKTFKINLDKSSLSNLILFNDNTNYNSLTSLCISIKQGQQNIFCLMYLGIAFKNMNQLITLQLEIDYVDSYNYLESQIGVKFLQNIQKCINLRKLDIAIRKQLCDLALNQLQKTVKKLDKLTQFKFFCIMFNKLHNIQQKRSGQRGQRLEDLQQPLGQNMQFFGEEGSENTPSTTGLQLLSSRSKLVTQPPSEASKLLIDNYLQKSYLGISVILNGKNSAVTLKKVIMGNANDKMSQKREITKFLAQNSKNNTDSQKEFKQKSQVQMTPQIREEKVYTNQNQLRDIKFLNKFKSKLLKIKPLLISPIKMKETESDSLKPLLQNESTIVSVNKLDKQTQSNTGNIQIDERANNIPQKKKSFITQIKSNRK